MKSALHPTDVPSMELPYDATRDPLRPVETGVNGFLVSAEPAAGHIHHIGSRWSGDTITLGGRWRVIATIVLLLPALWMFFFMGIGGMVFLAIYVFVGLPVALRDVWRRTRITVPPTPPSSRAP